MKLKRGTKREDGLVFFQYNPSCLNGERWITENQYLKIKKRIRELSKAARERRKDKIAAYKKKWRADNHRLCREYDKRTKSKFKNDPIFKLKSNYRRRLSRAIRERNLIPKSKTHKVIGCAWEDFKCHLEAQFIKGMTWENYGIYGWHVDHIVPLALATTEEELMILMHYTNTQPLWATDNLKKGASIPI